MMFKFINRKDVVENVFYKRVAKGNRKSGAVM